MLSPKMMSEMKRFAKTMKVVSYDFPKAIIRKAFTNANYQDVFPDMRNGYPIHNRRGSSGKW